MVAEGSTNLAPGAIDQISKTEPRRTRRAGGAGRQLLAVAFFDMVGYSRLIGLDDAGTVARMRALRQDVIEPRIKWHGGNLVQTAGDSLLVTFDSVLRAVRCAVDVQRHMPSHNKDQPSDRRMLYRIGVEIGDIIVDGGEFHGDSVNVATRLQNACPPGGICISRAVHDHVRDRLDVSFEELGPIRLKNISRPVEALVVRLAPGTQRTRGHAGNEAGHAPATAPAATVVQTASPWIGPYPRPPGGPPWVAVLPLQDLDNAPFPRHISDGIVADIVCQLAGLRELRVISHGSTLGLRDTHSSLRDIGQLLGARYLVRGGIRKIGTRTRITAELTVAESSEVVCARAADMDEPLSFEIQDKLVGQIVSRLAPGVQDAELRRIRGKRPESLSTYEKVLLARESIMLLERDHFLDAKSLLDEVIAQEPSYAEAYALAADWHVLRIGQDWSPDRNLDTAEVDRLARTALALDPDNVRALVGNGHRKSLLHRDYSSALDMFRRALDVSPNCAQAWQRSSFTHAYIGEAGEAIRRAERAMELSPCDREPHWLYSGFCVAHYTAGNFDIAAEWGRRALSEKTMLRSTAGWAAASMVAAGYVEEAKDVAARTMAQWPERRVSNIVAQHPYRDVERRDKYGEHLTAAGFP
jgi:adenylate cyclase